jgi:hypothetical protein
MRAAAQRSTSTLVGPKPSTARPAANAHLPLPCCPPFPASSARHEVGKLVLALALVVEFCHLLHFLRGMQKPVLVLVLIPTTSCVPSIDACNVPRRPTISFSCVPSIGACNALIWCNLFFCVRFIDACNVSMRFTISLLLLRL